MSIGKSFHLTLLVSDIHEADAFYDRLFSPHCYYRGYAPLPLHREASLLVIGDFVIEPMEPHPPEPGEQGTTIYRFLERFGPGVHSIAFYGTDLEERRVLLEGRGVRTTKGGMASTLFPHPKDFPGLVELCEPEAMASKDPRFRPNFDAGYWAEAHPLGILGASHVTIAVNDRHAARDMWVDLLDGQAMPEQESMTPGARSAYVAVGENTVIELAEPIDEGCPVAADLHRIGQAVCGVTFRVRDLGAVEAHLTSNELRIDHLTDNVLQIERSSSFGCMLAFTDRDLVGDPRP